MADKKRRWTTWIVIALLAIALFVTLVVARGPWRSNKDSETGGGAASAPGAGAGVAPRGGELVAAIRQDPPTFNRYAEAGGENTVEAIAHLLFAKLARVNRQTGELQPWLAESWSASPDGLGYTLTLREGLAWSDGQPFTSADVVFSFDAVYDDRLKSSVRSSMLISGKRIAVAARGARTVTLTFPAPFGPGLRILDNLVMLPRHKLEPALRAGTMGEAWGADVKAAEVVGMGPFRLSGYAPGERVVVEKNPHYWRRGSDGGRLPYLDRITLVVVRDLNTEVLRIQNGQVDVSAREIRPEDYAELRRLERGGRVQLADAGVGLDPNMLWFNLRPEAYRNDPRKPWLQSEEFRKAISHAVDRQAVVDQVYLGAGVPIYSHVTPGNRTWYVEGLPRYEYDPAKARERLALLGLEDRDGDGRLEDAAGRPVRFSILTQQQDTIRMRTASVIQEQLRKVGIGVDVVGIDSGSIVQRWAASDYDAIYFGIEASSHDPANNMDQWLSSGGFHVWNAGQKTPATAWEARVDDLMRRQAETTDQEERKRLFAQAQGLVAEHMPIVYFAAPRIVIAMTPRVQHAQPVPIKPSILWAADELSVK